MKQLFIKMTVIVILLVGHGPRLNAALPVTGVPVEKLSWIDKAMVNHMTSNGISGGIIGIMRNGVVIFQRGYGWKDQARRIAMPENALVRLASCTKPITAAAIRKLEAAGQLGLLGLNSYVFALGQTPPGIINIAPFSGAATNVDRITVQHCLSHQGGWNSELVGGDYALQFCKIADDLEIESPPGISNTIAWALSQPLQCNPGEVCEYSNFGYMVLAKIILIRGGMDIVEYHRRNVLTPEMWVPRTDLQHGRTFANVQPLREAWYDGGRGTCVFRRGALPPCVEANEVDMPYGTWDHESRIGGGGIVASAATMLELAERYIVGGEKAADLGTAISPTNRIDRQKGGTLSGTSTMVAQRTNGVNVFVFFNKYVDDRTASSFFNEEVDEKLDAQTDWPTTPIGGFWVKPGETLPGDYGSYDCPFGDLDEALGYLTDGSRVNFKPGSSAWKGTISTRLELRAPFGTASIGVAP